MSNVLSDLKQQQVLALGRLGWSLRRIEAETGVRRETASAYLKAAGIPVGGAGRRARVWPPPKPAITAEVSTDPATRLPALPGRAPSASACGDQYCPDKKSPAEMLHEVVTGNHRLRVCPTLSRGHPRNYSPKCTSLAVQRAITAAPLVSTDSKST